MGEPTKVYIDVDRCNQARHLQLAIGDRDGGYRLAGPGYMGNSTNVLRCRVDERDAAEIRRYLDKAFPPDEPSTTAEAISDLREQVRCALSDAYGSHCDTEDAQRLLDELAMVGLVVVRG